MYLKRKSQSVVDGNLSKFASALSAQNVLMCPYVLAKFKATTISSSVKPHIGVNSHAEAGKLSQVCRSGNRGQEGQ